MVGCFGILIVYTYDPCSSLSLYWQALPRTSSNYVVTSSTTVMFLVRQDIVQLVHRSVRVAISVLLAISMHIYVTRRPSICTGHIEFPRLAFSFPSSHFLPTLRRETSSASSYRLRVFSFVQTAPGLLAHRSPLDGNCHAART